MKKFIFLVSLVVVTMLTSCTNSLIPEIPSTPEELNVDKLQTRSAIDVNEEEIIPYEVPAEAVNSDYIRQTMTYDPYFDSNLSAIQYLPFTMQAREGSSPSGYRYLSTNGKGKEMIMAGIPNNACKFYIKMISSSLRIYSFHEKTPIAIGSRTLENCILYNMPNDPPFPGAYTKDAASMRIRQAATPGYCSVETSLYIPSGFFSPLYVIQAGNNNRPAIRELVESPQQQFKLRLDVSFSLQSDITFDLSSAVCTLQPPIAVEVNGWNTSIEQKIVSVPINAILNETSVFSQNSMIEFMLSNASSELFPRPNVSAGQPILPTKETKRDVIYSPVKKEIKKEISFIEEVMAPEKSLIKFTAYLQNYSMSINYTIKAKTDKGEEVTLFGTWKGTVITDPKIVRLPSSPPKFFDLETGEQKIVNNKIFKIINK